MKRYDLKDALKKKKIVSFSVGPSLISSVSVVSFDNTEFVHRMKSMKNKNRREKIALALLMLAGAIFLCHQVTKSGISTTADIKGINLGVIGNSHRLVHWDRNAFFGFELTLDSLLHPFSHAPGNPNFATLLTHLYGYIFKKIKVLFYQTVKSYFSPMQLSTTFCAPRIFHSTFSLLVLGSSHLVGSNQWTLII